MLLDLCSGSPPIAESGVKRLRGNEMSRQEVRLSWIRCPRIGDRMCTNVRGNYINLRRLGGILAIEVRERARLVSE